MVKYLQMVHGASVLAQPFNTKSLDKMWQLIPIFTFSNIFKDAKKFLRLDSAYMHFTQNLIFFSNLSECQKNTGGVRVKGLVGG